jgi:NAD+ kinase
MPSAPLAPGALVGLYAKPGHSDAPRLVAEISAWLQQRGFRAQLDAPADAAPALAVVLGGDGTMLYVARRLAPCGTPLLAVHLGTLGFLAETALADLVPSLEAALAGRAVEQRRAMLRACWLRAGREQARFDALNDVVVGKGSLARIVQIELAVDGESVGRYRADGVLVATPTGSTAYSFSAGGAVLHPEVGALIVTPICPHALNQRPLVVPPASEITLRLAAGEGAYLTVDGQLGEGLNVGDEIVCAASPLRLTLLTRQRVSFYQSLRAKMRWG